MYGPSELTDLDENRLLLLLCYFVSLLTPKTTPVRTSLDESADKSCSIF